MDIEQQSVLEQKYHESQQKIQALEEEYGQKCEVEEVLNYQYTNLNEQLYQIKSRKSQSLSMDYQSKNEYEGTKENIKKLDTKIAKLEDEFNELNRGIYVRTSQDLIRTFQNLEAKIGENDRFFRFIDSELYKSKFHDYNNAYKNIAEQLLYDLDFTNQVKRELE